MKWNSTDKGKEWHKNYDARNIRFEVTFRKESGIMAFPKRTICGNLLRTRCGRTASCRPKDKNNHSLFSCEALNTVIK